MEVGHGNLLERMQVLEKRTRTVERQLRRWRVLAFLLGIGAVVLGYSLPGHAQFTGAANPYAFTAPFVVKGPMARPCWR